MAKQLLFEDRARIKLLHGVETLAKAVAVTMGPTGRNVIIDKSFGNPVVTKDGVTVSKEVELDDPYEHMGAKLVNEVASKTSDVAGDGTTAATCPRSCDLQRRPSQPDARRESHGRS